ncbi:hypothetical protein FACS1894170_05530 [Planctomycetales bacterium]|nr:hypothetical protein FACS1894170_05530 [Planctomycetales bacterium]
MNVVDSSCWLEFAADNSSIGISVASIIASRSELLVPTITLFEVYKKASAMQGEQYAQQFIEKMLCGQVVLLDVELSIKAADVSRTYQLALADSIIYATASQYNAVLWTADKHFKELTGVRSFDKTPNRTLTVLPQ